MPRKLKIATSQFTSSGDISKNCQIMLGQISDAAQRGAEVIHFQESGLSGYAGIDFDEASKQDNEVLIRSLEDIKVAAARQNIWVLAGSHWFIPSEEKPRNSLFVIDSSGEEVARYDKRILFGEPNRGEHAHYSTGSSECIFEIKGIKCAALICHEWRYPEFYREYKKQGVELVFQSFYDGHVSDKEFALDGNEQRELVTGTMRGNAGNNYLWISVSNTTAKESAFPCHVLKPNGRVAKELKRNEPGICITEVLIDEKFVDASEHGRNGLLKQYYKK